MSPPVLGTAAQEEKFLCTIATNARTSARKLLLDDAVAADLAQEIVLECLINLRLGKLRVFSVGLGGFVHTMAQRRAVNVRRADKRRAERDAEFAGDINASAHTWMLPDVAVEERHLTQVMGKAINALPPVCRRVYAMVRAEGATYQDVADTLGVTRTAVNAQVVIAQRRLRSALAEQGITMGSTAHSTRRIELHAECARSGEVAQRPRRRAA